ncbi:hypothetical protein lerEdw1_010887 [Lerista edwardsae]|nr:hypothetical protein lerEdw1_010887 [Lerista edwardsae]
MGSESGNPELGSELSLLPLPPPSRAEVEALARLQPPAAPPQQLGLLCILLSEPAPVRSRRSSRVRSRPPAPGLLSTRTPVQAWETVAAAEGRPGEGAPLFRSRCPGNCSGVRLGTRHCPSPAGAGPRNDDSPVPSWHHLAEDQAVSQPEPGVKWIPGGSQCRAFPLGVDGFLIKNVRLERCLHASSHETEKVALGDCRPHSPQHQWSWDAGTRAVVNLKSGQCLAAHQWQELALAQLEPCGAGALQAWVCSKKGHLSVQGLGLHLSTKPGGHEALLTPEKDKFSRWKTAAGETVCAAGLVAPLQSSSPTEGSVGTPAQVPKSKTALSPETHTETQQPPLADPTATSLREPLREREPLWSTTLENEAMITSTVSQKEGTSLGQDAITTCTEVASLKKKMLSALKSRAEKSHKVGHAECLPCPGTVTGGPKSPLTPAPPSPSLRHGEILIEWKDGTITPLFDHMNYQIC